MHSYKTIIQKYGSKGEKSGWTYVDIPKDVLLKLKLKDKKAFRIKGCMDDVRFEKLSTYPVGDGEFIIALKADIRKKLGKKEGAMLHLSIELDTSEALISYELMDCLNEDKVALTQFVSQPKSHQTYFHNYILSAKTPATRAGRIVSTINAMHKKQNYGEMIRSLKSK
jgi:hypothetical protein